MPDDIKAVGSYEQDFFAWGLAQAHALRAARDAIQHTELRDPKLRRALQALDWENLAEEIEGLARRDRRELASHIVTIIEHLVKLQHSVARDPRASWMETVERARSEVEEILRDSPSLRREAEELIARKGGRAVQLAARALVQHREVTEGVAARLTASYTVDEVIGDWWPDSPPSRAKRTRRRHDGC
jgi:hypothetical protein